MILKLVKYVYIVYQYVVINVNADVLLNNVKKTELSYFKVIIKSF